MAHRAMTKNGPLSKETLESLERLGEILMKITRRLVSEGKAEIKDGKVLFKNADH